MFTAISVYLRLSQFFQINVLYSFRTYKVFLQFRDGFSLSLKIRIYCKSIEIIWHGSWIRRWNWYKLMFFDDSGLNLGQGLMHTWSGRVLILSVLLHDHREVWMRIARYEFAWLWHLSVHVCKRVVDFHDVGMHLMHLGHTMWWRVERVIEMTDVNRWSELWHLLRIISLRIDMREFYNKN